MAYDGADKTQLCAALTEFGLAPNKRLGQHFLVDKQAADKMVRLLGDITDETVLEIGPGAGAITGRLLEKAKMVTAIELDAGLVRLLNDRLPGANIVQADALHADLGAPDVVCANLPYYITTPLLMRLVEELGSHTLLLMMQREVADRLMATGGKAYGALSVAVGYRMAVTVEMRIKGKAYFPPPEVDSCVVRLTRRPFHVAARDEALLRKITRGAFGMRRKTLLNNLKQLYEKEVVLAALHAAGIAPTARAETVPVAGFVRLANAFYAWEQEARLP